MDIVAKLHACTRELSVWGKSLKSNYRDAINECKRNLEELRSRSNEEGARLFNAKREVLTNLLVQEDHFWRHRAKVHWLKNGDLNTQFFHASAFVRRNRNHIKSLTGQDGVEAQSHGDICDVAKKYFENIFEAKQSDYDPVLAAIRPSISEGTMLISLLLSR